MRKIYTELLPKKICNRHGECIDWNKSVGNSVRFEYDGINGNITIINYDESSRVLLLKYQNNTYYIHCNNFQRVHIGKLLGIRDNKFRYEVVQNIIDNKRDIAIVKRYYQDTNNHKNRKMYSCMCNKCNYQFEVDEYHLLSGTGCPCCASKVIVPGKNDVGTIYPFCKKFFHNKEYENISPHSGKSVAVICPDCGSKKKIIVSNMIKRKSIGCACSDNISYPNKFIFALIKQYENILNLKIIREYNPKWAKGRLYDLYFEKDNRKYVIEMDGGLGHGKKVMSNSKVTIEETKMIDEEKERMLACHNIQCIRIDADISTKEYLSSKILQSDLSKIINLENADFEICDKYALKNLVKEVCDIQKRNPTLCATDICKIANISDTTTRRYLHIGNEYGWCNYDFKKFQKLRAAHAISNTARKSVIQMDINDNIICIFKSMTEASKKTGIQISAISMCVNGKITHSKEYKWKYA